VRLILAIVQTGDVEPLLEDLAVSGFTATQIEGDRAGHGDTLAGVMVGVADDEVGDAMTVIHAATRARSLSSEPLRPIGERAEFWIPGPIERVAGGASVFVLPVRRYERIG
jgi:uncharacterized protein YaaQ